MIEEVKEISTIYNWKYKIWESSFPDITLADQEILQPIYGICFTPPKCETVSLGFLSNGVMVCPARIHFFGNSEDITTRSYMYQISVKTQYAGVTIHALLINLFKYLNDKYFVDFKMSDESQYWETGDDYLLKEAFKKYDSLLDNLLLSLETFPMQKGENINSYFNRLMNHINELRKQ